MAKLKKSDRKWLKDLSPRRRKKAIAQINAQDEKAYDPKEKMDRLRARLEKILKASGKSGLIVQTSEYGKDKKGCRVAIIKDGTAKKGGGMVYSKAWESHQFKKGSVKSMATGVFGQANRILKEQKK